MMQSSQSAEDVPQESSYRKPLVVIGSVAAVAAAIAIPVVLLYSSAPPSIELHDAFGNALSYPDLTSGFEPGQTLSFFDFVTPAIKCTLACVDGLSGVCETLSFSTAESGVLDDCMTHVASNNTRLVDVFWNSGKSVMGFLMTKRA
ncbi:MAG: hypothetical protein KF798_02725 [Candidatus Paracaedibacteraceae bacterium]|nr:hypothetical protein [Candidatus Paracaedibacteraceae bacterium]